MTTDYISKQRVSHLRKKAGLGILLALAVLLASPALGQQDRAGDSARGDSAKKTTTIKKARGRLPAYFSALVSQKQRAAIYKVQADYASQLNKLRAQLDLLVADRDRDVDAILDAEQLAKVIKKRADAKKKRAARSSARANPKESTDP